jgi:sugar lactone lactonase YvrE
MTTHLQADLIIDARAVIGEGPTWDRARDRLLWTDNALGTIYEVKYEPPGL